MKPPYKTQGSASSPSNAINETIKYLSDVYGNEEGELDLAKDLPEIEDPAILSTLEESLISLLLEITTRSWRYRIRTLLQDGNILIHLDNNGRIAEGVRTRLNTAFQAIYEGVIVWSEEYSGNKMAAQKLQAVGARLEIANLDDGTNYHVRTTVSIPVSAASNIKA